jgi:hypothetical protein
MEPYVEFDVEGNHICVGKGRVSSSSTPFASDTGASFGQDRVPNMLTASVPGECASFLTE